MKVFISWSGKASRELGEALHVWLPKVIQGTTPFLSSKDIDKGSLWARELQTELVDSAFGILCLTSENLASPWLHYEAGAISSAMTARVCPVLLGVSKQQVQAPLNQLQLTDFDLGDMTLLMEALNAAAGAPLSAEDVIESTATWWPKLEAAVSAIDPPQEGPDPQASPEPEKPQITNDELLQEVLTVVRSLERTVRLTAERAPHRSIQEAIVGRMDYSSNPYPEAIYSILRKAGQKIAGGHGVDDQVTVRIDGLVSSMSPALRGKMSGLAVENDRPFEVTDGNGSSLVFKANGGVEEVGPGQDQLA